MILFDIEAQILNAYIFQYDYYFQNIGNPFETYFVASVSGCQMIDNENRKNRSILPIY